MLSILACHSKDEDYMFWLEEKTFTQRRFYLNCIRVSL